jgi:hypothetical protein
MNLNVIPIPTHLDELAKVLRQLTPQEMMRLVELVPQLKQTQIVLEEQQEARDYFRQQALKLTDGKLPTPDDEFIEGVSYSQYLALSEAEQDAIWERIFAEDETGPYDLDEHDA